MYFVLRRSSAKHPCRWIQDWPFIKGVGWSFGTRIERDLPKPLRFTLERLKSNAGDQGPEMPEWLQGCEIPLFRDDLVEALRASGVDNIDFYETLVEDPDSGKTYSNYKAANIIGLVAAADMSRSEATVHPGGPVVDVDFEHLVLDEARARGALIFRLAESTGAILVHEQLRDRLLAAGFHTLDFIEPEHSIA
ncbi:MAG TPA: hypothetical protein PLB01_18420 [Thermoanaerobaculia bacterium]|nr:hypothetical protein [Thermoanaerobaculia bacterium]